MSARAEAPPAPPHGWRSLAAPGLATLVVLAILVGLGTWQLQRLHWKEGLIARIDARMRAEPVPAPAEAAWPAWSAADEEFTRVEARGTFRHDLETLVHGLAAGGRPGAPSQGFYVVTPLVLPGGTAILVNRGFVPTELADPGRRAAGRPDGEVRVVGLLRASEARAPFVPASDPVRGEWFVRDVPAIAEARGLKRAAPFLIEADATLPNPGGWPRGGQLLRASLPNNHLGYAFTWFGLALCLVGVFAVFARRHLRT